MPDFYDELAPLYHLIHQDWDASIRRQGEQLSALIKTEWPKSRRVLDVSCGIGGYWSQIYGYEPNEIPLIRVLFEAVLVKISTPKISGTTLLLDSNALVDT